MQPPALVLAADTIVALEDDVLGKPRDAGEARAMLAKLRGRAHTVYSAVTLHAVDTGRQVSDLSASDVPMRPYTNEELDTYVASGDPFDKAGAYAIQNPDFHPVQAFAGCYAGVMGLPLCHVLRGLRALGVASPSLLSDLPVACQSHLAYECPVTAEVLAGAPVDTP